MKPAIPRNASRLLALACVASSMLSRAAIAEPAMDVKEYKIDLDVNPVTGALDGTASIKWQAKRGKIDTITFDLEELTVTSASFNRRKVHHHVFGGRLKIFLEAPVWEGGTFESRILFRGVSTKALYLGRDEKGGHYLIAGGRHGWTRHIFPCKDQPDDRARFQVRITVPADYVAVSVGDLERVIELGNGRRRFVWKTKGEIPTYAFGMAVGKYQVVELGDEGKAGKGRKDLPRIRAYVFESGRPVYPALLERIAEDVERLQHRLGRMPQESLNLVQTDLQGTIESDGLILLGRDLEKGGPELLVPLARQWLGIGVGPKVKEWLWIFDGLAAYTGLLEEESRLGYGAVEKAMERAKNRLIASSIWGEEGKKEKPTASDLLLQGIWFAHMLEEHLTTSGFRSFLKDLVQRHKWRSVSLKELKNTAEKNSSNRKESLAWLFRSYLEGGVPRFKITWCTERHGISLDVNQLQRSRVFQGPLDLTLVTGNGKRLFKRIRLLPKRRAVYKIPCENPPVNVTADPYGKLLSTMEILPCDMPAMSGTPSARQEENEEQASKKSGHKKKTTTNSKAGNRPQKETGVVKRNNRPTTVKKVVKERSETKPTNNERNNNKRKTPPGQTGKTTKPGATDPFADSKGDLSTRAGETVGKPDEPPGSSGSGKEPGNKEKHEETTSSSAGGEKKEKSEHLHGKQEQKAARPGAAGTGSKAGQEPAKDEMRK